MRRAGLSALLPAILVAGAVPHLAHAGWEHVRTIEVEGRQGVACASDGYVVSGTTSLHRIDRDGVVLATNLEPFADWLPGGNHLGDIDVHDGKVFASAERFAEGRGHDMHVAIYDLETLTFERSIPVDPASGQVELCGVAVQPEAGLVWLADWTDGTWLYAYSLETGRFVRKLHLHPRPEKTQGVVALGSALLVSADDGDAELELPDHVYRVVSPEGPHTSAVVEELELTEVERAGEIEGLCHDAARGELVVHSNRGTRVIDGIPTGLYPGYEREIRELHVFRRKP